MDPRRELAAATPARPARAARARLAVRVGAAVAVVGVVPAAAALAAGPERGHLAVLTVAAALAAALAWWLARGVARRVGLLELAASRVRAGDLRVRVRPRGGDEVEDLIRAFNVMVEELEQSRARSAYLTRVGAWQELAQRLAHEIKNPLTPIQLAIQEVARRCPPGDPAFARAVATAREVIEEEVETLRRLVTAFSDFARLPDVKPARGDLAEFVRDAADGFSHATMDVAFDPGDAPVPVMLDRVLLRRALDILVRAAEDAGAKRAWVRAARAGDEARLVVEHDGSGVPAEHRATLFDPGGAAGGGDAATRGASAGLGLAIVRKVAIDHAGDAGVEERAEGGARFVVTLPVASERRRDQLTFVTFGPARPPVDEVG